MLCLICGLPGSGKTLVMSAIGEHYYRRGYRIYHNYSFVHGTYLPKFEDINNVRDGVLLMDEAHFVLDSRTFAKVNQIAATRFFAFSRHFGLMCFYTCQHPEMIDVRIRQLSDYLIFCTKRGKGTMIDYYLYQYQQLAGRSLIRDRSIFYHLYNTLDDRMPWLN